VHLRFVTYNIHKGIGGVDRKYRLERVRDVLAHYDADFVLLQEVDAGAKRSNHHRQIDRLGDWLGYRHRTWFPNHRLRRGGAYGNGILSRFPLTETSNIDVTFPRSRRRSVLHARFRVRAGNHRRSRTVHVYNLHLGLSGGLRKRQLRRFLESEPFTRLHPRTPLIVGGDFNDMWGTLGRKLLVPAGFRGVERPLRTFPAVAPLRALDGLYLRGDARFRSVQRSRLKLARKASDHLPLIAEIEIG
jgi:endonuclease/exonuclease/phosphatase family metal-dependent hydrolase